MLDPIALADLMGVIFIDSAAGAEHPGLGAVDAHCESNDSKNPLAQAARDGFHRLSGDR
jgi:hypothetical protein